MKHTVFIVEDEPNTRDLYEFWLKDTQYNVRSFSDAEVFLSALPGFEPSVICLDLGLPGISGMEALDHIQKVRPKVPVIVMTGDDDARSGVDAIKKGALDYIIKPLDMDEFLQTVENGIQRHQLELEIRSLRSQMSRDKRISGMVGQSAAINYLISQIGLVLENMVPVLLEGETGTGKEMAARTIHDNSNRSKEVFVPINCGAIPKELQESHFFGHEKGSFTGANQTRIGFFEEGNTGTVFLDEVGELTLEAQVKLLRVLQEKSVRRVGGNREIPVDVRIISATNRDLKKMVEEGTFREDLYYRLVVFPIQVPPLRQRGGDVPLLLGHFLRNFSGEIGLATPEITQNALSHLSAYSWPGNVRELQNTVQFALLSCKGEPIEIKHLPTEIAGQSESEQMHVSQDSVALINPITGKIKRFNELEKEIFLKTKALADGNVTQAAQMLGIGRATIYRKLQDPSL